MNTYSTHVAPYCGTILNSFTIRNFFNFSIIFLILSLYACNPDGKTKVLTETGEPADPPCVAPASWFTSPITPPDFNSFTDASSNCDFHLWAFQEFLYLNTLDNNGQRPWEAMADPHNLYVSSGKPLPYPGAQTASGTRRTLQPRDVKFDHTESAIDQAGGGVIFDQKGQVVYYEARVDSFYYDYIRKNGYYNPANIYKAPSDAQFPVGSVELKISWRVAKTDAETFIENADQRFITEDVLIAPLTGYNASTKKYIVDTDNPIPAIVALVGMHVVGLVKGHPEFVWATFEHVDNAPLNSETPTQNSGPTGPWSFYTPGTNCNAAPYCNQHPTSIPATPPYAPTQISLVNAQGGGDSTNVSNIIMLNESVKSQQQDPILKNYFYGGALWTNNGILPPIAANQKGSTSLQNSTLETFFQGPPPSGATMLNCFSCHNESPPVSTTQYPDWPKTLEINFSHLLGLSTGYKE